MCTPIQMAWRHMWRNCRRTAIALIAIVFVGPARDDLDLSIPGSGAPAEYDVVRGSLTARTAGVSTCMSPATSESSGDTRRVPVGPTISRIGIMSRRSRTS